KTRSTQRGSAATESLFSTQSRQVAKERKEKKRTSRVGEEVWMSRTSSPRQAMIPVRGRNCQLPLRGTRRADVRRHRHRTIRRLKSSRRKHGSETFAVRRK